MVYNKQIAGQVLGLLRTQKGMTQEVLSGLAGISRSHLAMIENGRKSVKAETLWRISAALGMRVSDVVRIMEERMEDAP